MQQMANQSVGVSQGQPILLVLPGCYHLSESEKTMSWDEAYHECMTLNGTLFYAANDLDAAWLDKMLAILPVGRNILLNLHSFLYSAKGWAWAPPPPSIGVLLCLLDILVEKSCSRTSTSNCTP